MNMNWLSRGLFAAAALCLGAWAALVTTATNVDGYWQSRAQVSVGGAPGYTAQSIQFRNSLYLTRGAGLTGAANNRQMLMSFWFYMQGGNSASQLIFADDAAQTQVQRTTGNVMFVLLRGPGGPVWQADSGANQYTTATNPGWNHIAMSFNQATPLAQMYINGVNVTNTTSGPNAQDIGWIRTNWAVGALVAGTSKLNADIADFYLHTTPGSYDLSVSTNLEKFRSSTGQPVDLGTNCDAPTGSQPMICFTGAVAGWETSKGTGLGFTVSAGSVTAGVAGPP